MAQSYPHNVSSKVLAHTVRSISLWAQWQWHSIMCTLLVDTMLAAQFWKHNV